ncbi:MAG: TlpA family protein disulfide reductase, partial [Spirochaetales bacterium]|nr:TlpA family protein disulfide reductase [Spirochaetales bacterium]
AEGDQDNRKIASDMLLSVFTTFLLVWKISPLVFRFSLIVDEPLSLLYLPGGIAGTIAGILASFVYLAVYYLRHRPLPPGLIRIFSICTSAALISFIAAGLLFSSITRGGAGEKNFAPEFGLSGLDGVEYQLSDYRGKYVVLNFWASWCAPCRVEVPELTAFHSSLKGNDSVVILAINQTSSEKNLQAVSDFAELYSMEFPILLDRGNRVHSLFGIRGIPTTFIIDPDGEVISRRTGAVNRSWLRAVTR